MARYLCFLAAAPALWTLPCGPARRCLYKLRRCGELGQRHDPVPGLAAGYIVSGGAGRLLGGESAFSREDEVLNPADYTAAVWPWTTRSPST